MSKDEKQPDKTSSAYQDGFKQGYTDKDKGFIETFLDSVGNLQRSFYGDNYDSGVKDGIIERDKDDLNDFKNEVRKK